MRSLPRFPVTTVGSWPRSDQLLRAQRMKRQGRLPREDFDALADQAVREVLRQQESAGVDVVTDGEQRRDNFFSFVADKLAGVRLFTLAELMDIFEDKTGFEQILQTLDVPAYAISNATCVDRVERRAPLAADDLRFVKRHTDRPVKITLPGPYLLTRAMYVPETARHAYPSKEDLGEDVVRVLRQELEELIAEGADFIQFDEPVLTELVFTQGMPRTFMCATLATRKDPAEELELAVALMGQVLDGISGTRTGMHVCRGNWSRNEATLLRGSYAPLKPYLDRMPVQQLVLEYATERAGDLLPFAGKELGLGVVNPRTETVESPEAIVRAVERALRDYPAEHVWLNPDCGFGTFSNRPMNSAAVAVRKLQTMAEAARILRSR
jgi:5-methyltetrahydropteroyltriglutamate--homocysteine methyltransferase